jgi:bifunctional DNA-binding transcriptional regulator/antitoxin component of YhaV-PrlF toxin-antitoxin module
MPTNQFRLSIGAKRQVTLPAELLDQLQVSERGELQIEVMGDFAVVTPMVSVPRTHLPEELRRTFESRRGSKSSDIPLARFLKEIGYEAPAREPTGAARQSSQQRLAGLTKNEKEEVSGFLADALTPPTRTRETALTARERAVVELAAHGKSNLQIARELEVTEHMVKTYLLRIAEKLGRLPIKTKDRVQAAGS